IVQYPDYLSYTNAWLIGQRGDAALVDSNLDWGQGLIALREFQTENDTGPVYLAYHGSALPSGYGVDYIPLPSYHPLPTPRGAESQMARPLYTVISATLLRGLKLEGDPYASFRDREPIRVLAGSLLVFRNDDP